MIKYGTHANIENIEKKSTIIGPLSPLSPSFLTQVYAFQVEPPISVELLVTECEPGEKGNTAQGATKPCIVETGAQVMVPLFVNEGDTLKIDTRTGEYSSRV